MKRYTVIVENGPHNLSAYVPDLPGCITTGRSIEEIEHNMREAIQLYIEGLREDGLPIPEPSTTTTAIDVDVAA